MGQGKSGILETPEVDRLARLVEEATRDDTNAPARFIEPARGQLNRAMSRRHHLVFGRRGSGKTSLLRKSGVDFAAQRIPSAFVDLETFKGHSYPDVLLSVLIKTLRAFDTWLETVGRHPASKVNFWRRLIGTEPKKPPLDKKKVESLRKRIADQIRVLEQLLHAADGATLRTTNRALTEAEESTNAGIKGMSASVAATDTTRSQKLTEQVEETHRAKIDHLHRSIMDYQSLFSEIVDVANEDVYIFLDDLYHIKKRDQADVIDYFHRIAKGRQVWLKVGSIRHRTAWYRHGDPPIGFKLGDEADDIDLDITLEKYENAKKFLLSILERLLSEAEISSYGEIIVPGGVQRLVLASGGVARDFLTIFRRAIDVARERGEDYRGPRITAEDVNAAAGEHDPSKRDELKRDTLEEKQELEDALNAIQAFCVEKKVNCILVNMQNDSKHVRLIHELVDLRFLHLVKSRLTVRDRPGELYSAYMLDISQYTGARKRREMQMVEFWKKDGLDRMRRASYVFDPDLSTTTL